MEKFKIIEIKDIVDNSGNDCLLVSANPVNFVGDDKFGFEDFFPSIYEGTSYFIYPKHYWEDELIGIANRNTYWNPNFSDFKKEKSYLNGKFVSLYKHIDYLKLLGTFQIDNKDQRKQDITNDQTINSKIIGKWYSINAIKDERFGSVDYWYQIDVFKESGELKRSSIMYHNKKGDKFSENYTNLRFYWSCFENTLYIKGEYNNETYSFQFVGGNLVLNSKNGEEILYLSAQDAIEALEKKDNPCYIQFAEKFAKMSIEELVEKYNYLVDHKGGGYIRNFYDPALIDEFKQRKINVSVVYNEKSISFEHKVAYDSVNKRLVIVS